MPETKSPLSEELQKQVDDLAREQHRQPAEVVEEAVRHYLKEKSWVRFVEKNEQRANALGIREEDVPRLVAEVRRENAQRGK